MPTASGLCDAEIMIAIVAPFKRFDRSTARRATRKTTAGSLVALTLPQLRRDKLLMAYTSTVFAKRKAHKVRKPAVPYVKVTPSGFGYSSAAFSSDVNNAAWSCTA